MGEVLGTMKAMTDQEIENRCKHLILEFFKGDQVKARYWFKTPNPILGGTPDNFIKNGRADRLLKWILSAKDENGW